MTEQVYLPILSPISIEKCMKMTVSEQEADWATTWITKQIQFQGI